MAKLTDLITKIDKNTGNVTIAFPVDSKVQVLANLPIDDANALEQYLIDYQTAYIDGLSSVAIDVDPTLQNKIK